MDVQPLNRRALALASEVIAAIRPEQLGLPTPCSAWTVGDLLRHMISQNKRFAAAARGEEADAACPLDGAELGDDPAATYRDSADLAVAAYLVEDIADRRMVLEELPGPLPAPVAISFHFTDSLVHGWDVARSIGVPFQPPAELSGAALGMASRIPDEARGPGGAFSPVVEPVSNASDFDRLLCLVGRNPYWAAPVT
ncbi:TIGR03086 family metal-binding protein [Parasphingorhabdus pacifica]